MSPASPIAQIRPLSPAETEAMRARRSTSRLALLLAALILAAPARAADADSLAKALSNPVAALVSVPLQYNYDRTWGAAGYRHSLNVQPVVPVSISEDWNMISRTILPIVHQHGGIPGSSQTGLGDAVQSLFFSPKQPTGSGLIWGVGPAALMPTGSDSLIIVDTPVWIDHLKRLRHFAHDARGPHCQLRKGPRRSSQYRCRLDRLKSH